MYNSMANAVLSRIEAAVSINFFAKLRVLFEHGLYSRAAFTHFSVIPTCLQLHIVSEIDIN